ncbi:importin alpha, putative [Entamoeba histolytica HM-1:IMSS-B]|uniref:Importin alpha, putative n=6 Tax=Entamoeba histolytica TaxID=5759 RepID=C4M0F5_ENTH1|nr:importin alpha, putative [Entamoeba histolytica HM-1:IMSS]EMD47170.1 importin subunit alpha3, putative [Entamoeba histolytica KU27]EMH73761.1 importin alpha, putative [Entamoeba histolytica HM-1:IMSS-B]EMS15089.1 importin subunit alpha-3, putative [Entamoeba histolytica HM-3:IMSS]ENY62798.1 importin subunit alpha-3, putative [Entamoeba histolytica HM-1:IMSS-A]GAT94641.1 importin alpha putative [Entamoeba histolytica]|eukprot:XP_654464.1 importin alpha, putative [Entamoeba histolytica HM-1:IMSS]
MNIRGICRSEDELKRRQKNLNQLRTKRRDHFLQQRRQEDTEETFVEPSNYFEYLHECKTRLTNPQTLLSDKIKIVINLRKCVSSKQYIPIQEMIECNTFSILLKCMTEEQNDDIKYQIAWFFTNLAVSLDSETSDLIVHLGVIKVLLHCGLTTQKFETSVQCLWGATNYVIDSNDCKEIASANGIFTLLNRVITNDINNVHAYWSLSSLLRTSDCITSELLNTFIQYIAYGLSSNNDPIIVHCIRCVFYIGRNKTGLIKMFNSSIFIRCFYLASSNNQSIKQSSFKFIQWVSSSNDADFIRLFDITNIIPYFIDMLKEIPLSWYHRIIMFTFSNLALTNDKYIDQFIDNGTYYIAIQIIINSTAPEEALIRKECFLFIFYSIQQHYIPLLDHLIQNDFIISIFSKIKWTDNELVAQSISAAEILIHNESQLYQFIDQFREIGFDKRLQEITENSDNEDLVDRVSTLLLEYFDGEEHDELSL